MTDERGLLFELLPGGTRNEYISGKIGNIYASVATKRFTPRAGHYHRLLEESFFTLSGAALWYFRDFREKSATFGRDYLAVIGDSDQGVDRRVRRYLIDDVGAVHVVVPPGVYHIYFPLTSKPVLVVAVGSREYNHSDYFDPIEDKRGLLKRCLARSG